MPSSSSRVLAAAPGGALTLLVCLTLSRTAVAFQFQSITLLVDSLRAPAFGAAGLGILLGLYMAPGALVALTSPVLISKFGAATTVIGALLLMATGQLSLLLSSTQELAYLSRLVAGVGGCIVYIVTIDLAARYCAAGAMPGRMGAIASSWPLGNALSLMILGALISRSLPGAASYLPAAFAFGSALLIAWALQPKRLQNTDPGTQAGGSAGARGVALKDWWNVLPAVLLPGLAFGLYNVSFIVFTSFSPELLRSQGHGNLAASTIASLPMWFFVVSVPLGGWMAGRLHAKGKWFVGIGCLGGSACILLSHMVDSKVLWYVLAGILGGLPTGAMLARGGKARHALFYPTLFLIFFVLLLVIPPVVGAILEATGILASVPAMCIIMLWAAFLFFIMDESS
ncbi:MAG TPA: MFS transporter [Burkholderiaceae bacterium]|nr:MFS transporter [Burkholderiaceae bacterium]